MSGEQEKEPLVTDPCPNCGRMLGGGYRQCPSCGKYVCSTCVVLQIRKVKNIELLRSRLIPCPYCGRPLFEDISDFSPRFPDSHLDALDGCSVDSNGSTT